MYVSIFRILNTDTREPRYLYLESRARILGNQDIYMREGSAVELECGIENIPAPPAYIYWYKVGIHLLYIYSFYVQGYQQRL